MDSAVEHGVKNVVVLSTDKAAYPINAMGISKAMMEKVAIAKGRQLGDSATTTICCTRYGNVMASRGSVIPLWIEQMKNNAVITITDPNMTRFMMTLDDAVDLVVYAFEHGRKWLIIRTEGSGGYAGYFGVCVERIVWQRYSRENYRYTAWGEAL